jgi:glutaredoxin
MNREMRRFAILILLLLLLLFMRSTQYKEHFVDAMCGDYDTCVSCTNKSNCDWCEASKKCLSTSEITKNDSLCNQMNVVYTPSMCRAEPEKKSPNLTVSNSDMEENPLYRNQVNDTTAPPMVYLNKDMSYSPETVMANVSNLRNEVQNLMNRT